MIKKITSLIFLIFIFSTGFSLTNIIDEGYNTKTNYHFFHSFGILSYGLHSNTFHLRNAFFKYSLNISEYKNIENAQFFITIRGYKDTHLPETNYPALLNNIELYDYGINLWLGFFYISLRGVANYTQNLDTLLLFLPYRIINDTEFDASCLYRKLFYNSPGIRVGIDTGNLLVAYSQGDYRHLIPSGFILKYQEENFYIRWVFLFYHNNPLVYEPENLFFISQISTRKDFLIEKFKLTGIIEATYYGNDDFLIRLEEGISYNDFIFGIRQLYDTKHNNFLIELSLKKNFYGIFNIGFQFSIENRYYLATEINF